MFDVLQITLIVLLLSSSLALVCRQGMLYFRWKKEKPSSTGSSTKRRRPSG